MLVETASSAAALEELRSANVAEVRDGYRISWLQGHSVINDQNEMIGIRNSSWAVTWRFLRSSTSADLSGLAPIS
jgi:hypothetical protein